MKVHGNNLAQSVREFGFWLLVLRAPRVILRSISVRIETWYWSLFLGSMGKNVRIGPGVKIHRPGKVFIGNNVVIGEDVIIGTENAHGVLKIEDDVQINRCCQIDHSGDTVIGSGTLISEDSNIISHSHGYEPRSVSKGIPKRIGTNCWIGVRVVIGENAQEIADSVIVATGSIVVRSCDKPHSIYGGVPAKWIKSVEI